MTELTEEDIAKFKHAIQLRDFLEYLTGLEGDMIDEYKHLFDTTKADSEFPPINKHKSKLLVKFETMQQALKLLQLMEEDEKEYEQLLRTAHHLIPLQESALSKYRKSLIAKSKISSEREGDKE